MLSTSRDGWLSTVTGLACHKMSGHGDAPAIAGELSRAGDGFYFVKLPVADVTAVKSYTAAGFFLVDTGITFEMGASSGDEESAPRIDVRLAGPVDHAAAQEIAATSFIYSRFHLDPLFPKDLANRIKREWIRSYCEGSRGDALLIAVIDGRVAGFLAAIMAVTGGQSVAVIDLIAVDGGARGRGVGRALLAAFREHYRGRAGILRVGTQLANNPSIGLYGRFGFVFAEATHVLHAHRRNGACL